MKTSWCGALALLCCSALSGCAVPAFFANVAYEQGSELVLAEYTGLQDRWAVVIVEADPVLRASEPRLINRITNAVVGQLSRPEVGLLGIVPGPTILEFQYATPSWPTWSYARLTEEFTADRLIVIDIYEYRLNEVGNRHLFDGVAAARVGVYEAGTGSEEFSFAKDIRVSFPDGQGYTDREISRGAVGANLETRLVIEEPCHSVDQTRLE
ncbi:MAG: hypothetical protein AAFX05_01540, partial [Planctomycetota bacterium]